MLKYQSGLSREHYAKKINEKKKWNIENYIKYLFMHFCITKKMLIAFIIHLRLLLIFE